MKQTNMKRTPLRRRSREMDDVQLADALPDDLLACVVNLLGDEDAICAMHCVNKRFASLVSCDSHAWSALAAAKGMTRCEPLGWQSTVIHLRRISRLLQPFAVLPPSCTPQKLRCQRDPASAVSALQLRIGVFGAALQPSLHASMAPLTSQERAWINWFGRMQNGALHIESCRLLFPPGAEDHY